MSHWKNPATTQGFSGSNKGLLVNNSLTNSKVPFVPINGNTVTWYMCGPTVYDVSHVGHARAYLTFDIIRRIMQDYFKYKVFLVMNITDVDDKIIKRTVERLEASGTPIPDNIDTTPLTREMEQLFWKDMQGLNVLPPNVITRVTEYMPQIIAFIQKIVANGFAYESNGSIYFDTEAFSKSDKHVYGKLCPGMIGNEEALREGEGALSDFGQEKRSQKDFALWKKSKEKEPWWESPWGRGRPGWHIECSAMAGDILGSNIDIHSGGIDLRFPHHENELAQSEACFDCPQWINYFLHAGHLHIDGCKMSKSLKNFIAIQDALKQFSADEIRMFYLMHRYDGPLDWSEKSIQLAQVEAKQFQTFFQNMTVHLRNTEQSLRAAQNWGESEKQLFKKYGATTAAAHEALCDNFDTPKVIQVLKELIAETNRYIATRQADSSDSALRVPILFDIVIYISDMLRMFGMGPVRDFGIAASKDSSSFEQRAAPILDVFCQFRDRVRSHAIANKHQEYLQMCDWARNDAAPNAGIQIEDRKEGAIFKLRDREELLAELKAVKMAEEEKKLAKEKAAAERQAAKEEKARKQAEQIAKQKQKEAEKAAKAASGEGKISPKTSPSK